MNSMTGYGHAEAESGSFTISADVSTVNKRGLEISSGLPREWLCMELAVGETVKKHFARGKVNVTIRAENGKTAEAFELPQEPLRKALRELGDACKALGVKFEPNHDTLLKLREASAAAASALPDWKDALPQVQAALEKACLHTLEMRKTEGENLEKDLSARLKNISALVERAEKTARENPPKYKETLLQKLAALGLNLDVNDERVLKEVCIFADKADVCEEMSRLKSHISQFENALKDSEPVGRKMDFICQEMGRERNTTASKANNIELTKTALELKNELERLREQVQNVE